MALTSGTRIGAYEIVGAVGAGGMGEVYRARDTKLNRDAAIKVLPAAFARDANGVARLRREAQVLASLNHPHIASIHGLEETNGMLALALEFVEGDDLAMRLARGAIPVEEAIAYARQIVDALEAAHEKGIVHRDLKPANIKVTKDGAVKVLDFGLAKACEADALLGGDPGQSPTRTRLGTTEVGVVMGTAAYMSPEQARGRPVDKRSDIWACGVVLFEILTGRQLVPGETTSDANCAVPRERPDLQRVLRPDRRHQHLKQSPLIRRHLHHRPGHLARLPLHPSQHLVLPSEIREVLERVRRKRRLRPADHQQLTIR